MKNENVSFLLNDAATPEIYTLSLPYALPILEVPAGEPGGANRVGAPEVGDRGDCVSDRPIVF